MQEGAATLQTVNLPPPSGVDSIRDAIKARNHRPLGFVLFLAEPAFAGLAAYLVFCGGEPWRRISAAINLVLMAATIVSTRRLPEKLGSILRWLVAAHLVFISGGLYSPVFPFLLIIVTAAPALQSGRVAVGSVLFSVVFTWMLAALALRGPSLVVPRPFASAAGATGPSFAIVYAACMTSLIMAAHGLGRWMKRTSDVMFTRSLCARRETLGIYDERLRDMTTQTAAIAHELNNPLASIKGLAALMELDPARAPEHLRVLQKEVERMRCVLEELLSFSRPLTPLALEQVNLRDVVMDVVDLHGPGASAKKLRFDTSAVDAVEVRCDPRKVKQILIHLVQNAIDASPSGAPIALTLRRKEAHVLLGVLDRGPGLAPERLQRVFEPGVTSKPKGPGLGLTIVRALAAQHCGSVALSNRPDGGLAAQVDLLIKCPKPTQEELV
jgi:signal transduction histidine kinase